MTNEENISNEENMVNFDLSALTISELINLYEVTNNFLQFLNDQKKEEDNGGEANE